MGRTPRHDQGFSWDGTLPIGSYGRWVKRALDLVVAFMGLLLLSPVIAILALVVLAKLGSPILFRQQRPGLNCRPFTLLKFRTMLDSRDPHGSPLEDSQRLTGFGKFLRASSLDELPELVNVLRGEMSLIGPRPLLMHYLPFYSKEQKQRHLVRPGITGWAQVNGRNEQSWDERFEMDAWYVEHYGIGLDLKILALTAWRVLRREGVSQSGDATMPEFRGNSGPVKR